MAVEYIARFWTQAKPSTDWFTRVSFSSSWRNVFLLYFSRSLCHGTTVYITAGVRQGGILSPDFYCLYVDGLLAKLQKCGKGCYYLTHFAAALFYADDMAILAPSIKGITCLLRICGEYCAEFDIGLNA